ncbi:aspartate aminotransferase family protein [Thermoactinomyces vulgaris]|uniref:aspartate aminotransferase family protein n=1 Tax=Thermoactinomyces vulgaris TaxID=2026 RepID=UPI003632C576
MFTSSFAKQTSGSAQAYQEACQWLPGGVTANIKYFSPYPIMMEKADGAYLWDIDKNRYIDYNLCYGALVLGHGHLAVNRAIQTVLNEWGTTSFGTPHALEQQMAERLAGLYPGIEKVRYTHSGMEATLLAIRLATAWTGKKKIVKFDGHYHGSFDQVLINVNPSSPVSGAMPVATSDSYGLSEDIVANTLVLPFNDLDRTAEFLRRHHAEIGAVILEPVQAGYIPPDPEFLKGLRKVTRERNMVLIFDEIKTGFRISLAGAQGYYGVSPDLTTLGKVLGGGFPVGVVGGRKDILDLCSPTRGTDILSMESGNAGEKPLFHSGTHNGHPLTLAAGWATLQLLEKKDVYSSLEKNTMRLRNGIEEILNRHGLDGKTVGVGSIFNLVFTNRPIRQVYDVLNSNRDLRKKLDFLLLEQGIYIKPLNRFSTSVAHTPEIIDETLEQFEKGVLKLIKQEMMV